METLKTQDQGDNWQKQLMSKFNSSPNIQNIAAKGLQLSLSALVMAQTVGLIAPQDAMAKTYEERQALAKTEHAQKMKDVSALDRLFSTDPMVIVGGVLVGAGLLYSAEFARITHMIKQIEASEGENAVYSESDRAKRAIMLVAEPSSVIIFDRMKLDEYLPKKND